MKIVRNIIIAVLLIAIIAVALYFRIILPSGWLQGQTLRMSTVDAYYQLRMAELIKTHGVDLPTTDPYFISTGETTFDKAKNPIIWPLIIEKTSGVLESFHVKYPIETAGLFLPPLFAALIIIVVFLLGVILFNPWVGLVASLLMGTLAGEFMGRSIMGSADYHVFEVFLVVCFMLFLFLSNKLQAAGNNIGSILVAVLTGFIAALYAKAWAGAGYLFMLLVTAYALYLIILSWRREIPSGAIFAIITISLSSTIFFYIVINLMTMTGIDWGVMALIVICLVFSLVATPLQTFCTARFNKYVFSILVAGMAGIAALGLYFFASLYYYMIVGYLSPLIRWQFESHTAEELPIMLQGSQFTLYVMWGNFTASLYLCLIGIGMLIRKIFKESRESIFNYAFLIVGSVLMLFSTLAMRRFSYYFIIFVSILSAFVIYTMIKVVIDYLVRNKSKLKWFDKISDVFLLTILLSFIFAPNFITASQFVRPLEGVITPGWEDAMLWLKSNSPEPFTNTDYYYANYNKESLRPQYSVLSWWDYGYWIMYVAHRVPTCNPGSGNRDRAAAFLTTGDPGGAKNILSLTKSRYIVIDWQTATGKFTAMPSYIESSTSNVREVARLEDINHYMNIYGISRAYQNNNGELNQVTIFYPNYYRSMTARLFNFNGKAVKSPGCPVVIFDDVNGVQVVSKIIDTPSYNEALAYASTLKLTAGQTYALCGFDPFISCVDLEELTDYTLVRESGRVDLNFVKPTSVPEVRIFAYTGDF